MALILAFTGVLSVFPSLVGQWFEKNKKAEEVNYRKIESEVLQTELEKLQLKHSEAGVFEREKYQRLIEQKVLEGEEIINLRGLAPVVDENVIFKRTDETFEVLNE